MHKSGTIALFADSNGVRSAGSSTGVFILIVIYHKCYGIDCSKTLILHFIPFWPKNGEFAGAMH